ncbi:MAG TPA: hypothetical protein VGY50_02360 [Streptosporangiaceae bacterium]|nr:hypothetical protein [Streptosporangiaceae bacterium]
MGQLLADPVAEARQLISLAAAEGLVMRALGGVAVYLQSDDGQPRLVRSLKDIDLAVARGSGKAASRVLAQAAYVADEMFNALRGSRRLLYHDPRNGRHVDVFVGEFSMCHELPLTERLGRDPLTVPREELLLSKLQVVELTGNDQADIYNLLYHHDVGEREDAGISSPFIAALCARDWGLWRTCQLNIGRSLDNLGGSGLGPAEQQVVAGRLESLRGRIDAEPKSRRWRIRNQVGDKVRWYAEPEQEQPSGG